MQDTSRPNPDTPILRTVERSRDHLSYLLIQWLRQCWDELGTVVWVSSFWFVFLMIATAPLLLLPNLGFLWAGNLNLISMLLMAAFLVLVLWGGICAWFAANRFLERVLTFHYPEWYELPLFLKAYLFKSLGTVLFLGGLLAVLIFNLMVYSRMFPAHPFIQMCGMIITGWMIFFLGLVQVHLVPFLVHQDRPFFTALKRSALVAVWKPFRTLFILLVEVIFFPISFLPPFCFFLPGVYAMLANLSLLTLLDEWHDPNEKTPEAIRAGS